jgi:predicted anti-sigma-YlaC factor YlaD
MERHVGTRAQKLAQLLGPAGAEIGCDECFDLLDEFVELELAGLDADAKIPGLRAHLEGCSACREEHDSLATLVEAQRA